jgi:hypothetical protein
MTFPLGAAPLSPTDPWASDAVRVLQEKGLIKGYPDGTFKGDRALGRYELAVLVARLLVRLEDEHASLATRPELEEVQALARALADELAALGVRLEPLEEQVQRLERRVYEVGRIQFSGQMVTRALTQVFSNDGNSQSGTGAGSLNYNAIVGSTAGSNLLPFGPSGILAVVDFVQGRPLTNGTGFSSTLYLTAAITPDDDWNAELRVYGYSSQGDAVVDAVWGATPPYLSNSFTGTAFDPGGQRLNHTPFTRAGFDRLRLAHSPSGLTFTLGTFRPERMPWAVYLGEPNPGVEEPRVLESFGAHLTGDHDPILWEVFGTRLADGNPGVNQPPYQSLAVGAGLTWKPGNWNFTLCALRALNEAPSGRPLTVGQINLIQATPGRLYTDWVNPPEYFVGNLGGPADPRVAGAGSTSDVRPVPGNPGSDALGFASTFGPQSLNVYGASLQWTEGVWTVLADYARSSYKPNRNSPYSTEGQLYRLGVQADIEDPSLQLILQYRYTDPNYDPFILTYPGTVAGLPLFRVYYRLPDLSQFWHLYSLHDTKMFPHNRRGLWFTGRWGYHPDGLLTVSYRHLDQVRTSLQDVRYAAGSLGPGLPTSDVLGHAPGFRDTVFREFSPLSFDARSNPLENPRGQARSWLVEVAHTFSSSPWRLEARYEEWRFSRPTSLGPAQGGSQNHVDLRLAQARLAVGYQVSENLLLTAGYQRGEIAGHYDPAGFYNPVALALGSTGFKNWDSLQHQPFLSADWDISETVKLQVDYEIYRTIDRVPGGIFPGPAGGPNSTAHPFSWSGHRLGTTMEVSF